MARYRRGVLRGLATLTAGAAIVGTGGAVGPRSCDRSESDGGWTNGGADRRYDGTVSIDPDSLAVAWRYRPEGGAVRNSQVVIAGGRLFLNADEAVQAVDVDSGERIWETAVSGDENEVGPVVDSGTVYVGGDRLTAHDADDGSVRWRADHETEDVIAEDGLVYAYHDDDDRDDVFSNVTAYDAAGDEQWSALPLDAPDSHEIDAYRYSFDMTYSGETLYVSVRYVDYHQGIAAFDAKTGELEWIEPEASTGGTVTEFVSSDRVLVYGKRADDMGLTPSWEAYDNETGELLTTFSGTTDSDAARFRAVDGKYVYSRVVDPHYDPTTDEEEVVLHVRDVETDEAAWEYANGVGSMLITDDAVFAATSEELVGLDPDDGEELWTYTDEDGGFFDGGSLVAVDEETIYVFADGELVALRSSNADGSTDDTDENDDEDNASGSRIRFRHGRHRRRRHSGSGPAAVTDGRRLT